MAFTLDFGGTANNDNAFTSNAPGGIYTDGMPFPVGNLDFNGNHPVYISSLTANPAASAGGGLNYRAIKGGVSYAAGQTVLTSGGTFRFRIGYSSGTLNFWRDDNSGGLVVDEAGGSWGGRLTGRMVWFSVPGAVRNYSAVLTSTPGQVAVNFDAPVSNGGDAIINYPIRWSRDGGATWSSWVYNVSGTQLFSNLGAGTYIFQILAQNSAGNSNDVITNSVTVTGIHGQRRGASAFAALATARRFTNDDGASVELSIMRRHTGSGWADILN